MKYITHEILDEIKKIDLLTYLQNYEPWNLRQATINGRKLKGIYCTSEHDSLKIQNGMWHWWSRGIGGKSALNYLIKVVHENEPDAFLKSCETLCNCLNIKIDDENYSKKDIVIPRNIEVQHKQQNVDVEKKIKMPPIAKEPLRVKKYLIVERCLSNKIVNECIERKIIAESSDYHNVIFIGRDYQTNEIKFGARRACNQSRILGDIAGSDKSFSFRIEAKEDGKYKNSLHIFEGAIDALSYATLLEANGKNYHDYNLLSLSGVSGSKNGELYELPIALRTYLKNHNVNKFFLHLDNDEVGISATNSIISKLKEEYPEAIILDHKAPYGKDWNDTLVHLTKEQKKNKDELNER